MNVTISIEDKHIIFFFPLFIINPFSKPHYYKYLGTHLNTIPVGVISNTYQSVPVKSLGTYTTSICAYKTTKSLTEYKFRKASMYAKKDKMPIIQ